MTAAAEPGGLTRTTVVNVVEVNRVRLVELDSVIAAMADALERPDTTTSEHHARGIALLRALREMRDWPLPADRAESTAVVPLEVGGNVPLE